MKGNVFARLKSWKSFCLIYIFVSLLCYVHQTEIVEPQNRSFQQKQYSRKFALTHLEKHQLQTSLHCEVSRIGCLEFNKKINIHNISEVYDYLTPDWCFSLCSRRSAVFAGLKSGDTCICAENVSQFGTYFHTACPSQCKGGTGICGGDDAVDVYRIVSPCIPGRNVTKYVEESRFLGCFRQVFTIDESSNQVYRKNLSPRDCILLCNLHKLPLAMLDPNSGCTCGQFSETFNLTNKVDCDQMHTKVYRTFSEDTRCGNVRLLPPAKRDRTALVSFPGSGNTWTRYLIHRATGVYTSSRYGDKKLYKTGFLAEALPVWKNRTVVVKDHMFIENTMFFYQSVIAIIRNPYDAIVANYNSKCSRSHTGTASEKQFQSDAFSERFDSSFHHWLEIIEYVVSSGKPTLIIEYGELVKNPIAETLKIVKFLKKHTVISPDNLQQRLLCLSQELNGENKRKKGKLTIDSFTNSMKERLNQDIVEARKIINEHGLNFLLPKYERSVV
ncbi:sialate:O-sulfotransferase 1-like [Clavelina lepadiformis]|uniref:WSC domain-containing protein n=1 Tax=Clavelina lepadiformis TaxID=159417 RepID=A0ABP0GVC3_CLALP